LDKLPASATQQASTYGAPEVIPAPIEVPNAAAAAKLPRQAYSSPAAQQFASYATSGRESLAHGDAAAAEYSFNQALEVNPFDPVALNNLAVAKAERNQFYSALGLLERAAKLAPSNAEVAANLARMRLYVAETATVGRDPLAPLANVDDGLPPLPPQLWDASLPLSRSVAPGYYSSAACSMRKGQAEAAACVTEPSR
jgi:tetratricopeptide (TPR) repeat protein